MGKIALFLLSGGPILARQARGRRLRQASKASGPRCADTWLRAGAADGRLGLLGIVRARDWRDFWPSVRLAWELTESGVRLSVLLTLTEAS